MILWALVALALVAVALSGAGLWLCWLARRDTAHTRLEVRAARLQLSNLIEMLMAAGFKRPKRPGWEDDFQETQFRDGRPPPPISWWRLRQ